ncbi:MAG: bifunctional 5,10-methylenetetrahydrofolate dehydrogenase/5,10-methenyltetrahydrofolate cyclohydrolase [Candidatus Omnitrophota bacterium]
MAKIVDGREIAKRINDSVAESIRLCKSGLGYSPKLVSLLAGESKNAELYVNMQKRAAELVGIDFERHSLDGNISENELLSIIRKFNSDKTVTSIIIQKPLPDGINHNRIAACISHEKDAEGIHPYNMGMIVRKESEIVPCTPGAVMEILRVHGIDLYGKEAVIIGHSAIVGKPLSVMMLNEMATTTVCHIGTFENGTLQGHVKRADILIVAVGKSEFIGGGWIKEGAVVIDVGINKTPGGIVGDVEFSSAVKKASLITPVPGGVGPVTVSILMRNVLKAYKRQNGST